MGYEYRRYAPGESLVSTFEFHEHRERAPHLEQGAHVERLHMTRNVINDYRLRFQHPRSVRLTVVDLGCGDGGLLQLLKQQDGTDLEVDAAGYDFMPANPAGWAERGVDGRSLDFITHWDRVEPADLYVLTEVLEHLEDPHGLLAAIADRGAAVVCSSPWTEHAGSLDPCHNWAWDMAGYAEMLVGAGFDIPRSERVTWSQVHLAVPRA